MKKVIGWLIAGLLCISVICVAFVYTIQRSKQQISQDENLTEVQKIISKDLISNYPGTPREVVKLYNRIITSYYGENYTEEEFQQLVSQAQKLMDAELLAKNGTNTYITNLTAEINDYKKKQKKISQSSVCDSNSVKFLTDGDDQLAYVTASYFMKEGSSHARTHEQYVLRQDAEGKWKILVFYQIKGASEEDD